MKTPYFGLKTFSWGGKKQVDVIRKEQQDFELVETKISIEMHIFTWSEKTTVDRKQIGQRRWQQKNMVADNTFIFKIDDIIVIDDGTPFRVKSIGDDSGQYGFCEYTIGEDYNE